MPVILHSDLNCFYASVEMNEHPELRDEKVAVCGSVENRHGIVLTASYPAKRQGVRTGMANWQALQVCPDLIMVPPHYDLYLKYSRLVRRIYQRYTGYPGGQRETTPAKVRATHPERILEHAIRGMLPKNRLGDALYRNLYIYAGSEHPHQAQNPKVININDIR